MGYSLTIVVECHALEVVFASPRQSIILFTLDYLGELDSLKSVFTVSARSQLKQRKEKEKPFGSSFSVGPTGISTPFKW